MLRNVEFASKPEKVTIERRADVAVVTYADNIQSVTVEGEEHFTADLYTEEVQLTPDIDDRINGNFETFLNHAKNADREREAATVRAIRNRLLSESDAFVALDRFGITIPDNVTATTMLKALKDFFDGINALLAGDWAKYRQALRDLPQQEGFPYSIVWPEKPMNNNE